MAHHHSAPGASEAPPASHDLAEEATLIGTLVHLLIAKVATLAVPCTFKWAIDALTAADTAPVQSSNWTLWLIASPFIMTLSYGGLRVLMAVLTQWRDGILR